MSNIPRGLGRRIVRIAGFALVTGLLPAQVRIDLRTQAKNVDFSAAASTKPFKTGTALPAACETGESFFWTTAPAGSNLYGCAAPNVWTQLGGTAVHTHPLTDLNGVSGKHGSASVLQAYAGGSTVSGNCAAFDSSGNLIDSGAPCQSGSGGSVTAGEGIVVAGSMVSIDDTVVPSYLTGSGAPIAACMAGRDLYVDTSTGTFYVCWSANLWRAIGESTLSGSTLTLDEEFTSSAQASSPFIGSLGWVVRAVGTSGSTSYQSGTWPAIGVLRIQTPALAGSGQAIALDQSNAGLFSNISTKTGWELQIRFKLAQTGNSRLRLGFLPPANATATPADGLFLRYDTTLSDTSFQFESRNGGSANLTNTGVPVDTGWHTVKIQSTTAGSVRFQLDHGAVTTITTGIPNADLTLGALLVNGATATAGNVELDYVKFQAKGLAR